jgi:hypothetical protein
MREERSDRTHSLPRAIGHSHLMFLVIDTAIVELASAADGGQRQQ